MTDSSTPDEADSALLHQLRVLWSAADPMPTGLTAKVLAGLAVEDLDAEYELLHLLESRVDLAGARADDAGPGTMTLQFTHETVEVLLRVSPLDDGVRRLDGWLAPAGADVATLRSGHQVWRAPIDSSGRFEFAALPQGAVRLWLDGGENDFSTTMFEI